jgi:DNA-binding phage protein
MKHKASTSHDEAVRELRENPDFAAEYLRAALEDTEEPRVLLVALRRVAEARGGVAKVASVRACMEHGRRTAILACPHWLLLRRQWV